MSRHSERRDRLRMRRRLGLIPAALLLGVLAYGQPPEHLVIIEKTGVVHAGHETAHARNGHIVRWDLGQGATSWYVVFPGASPCDNGKKAFGSEPGLTKTCPINHAAAGTYKYSTSDH